MSKDRGSQRERTTGKNRRAAKPGAVYAGRVEDLESTPWRDQVGSDMETQTGFTESEHTPVLICTPTHEIHVVAEDGSTSTNSWAEGLPIQRFRQVTDMRRLDEISVDMEWTAQLGRSQHLPGDRGFVTLTGAVRGPSPAGTGVTLFYQGPINTLPEWVDAAKRGNKLIVVTYARQGSETWAVAAHLNRPRV